MEQDDDIGKIAEEIVHSTCEKMFLRDFVVRNPKFKKKSGLEHEIADSLVMFKDYLICFQVKSKIETKKVSDKDQIDNKRIEKRIREGINQVSVINTALRLNEIIKVENSIGIEIEVSSADIKKIIGIVILNLAGEESFPEHERSEVLGGFEQNNNIPVHIFMREDLELISSEIDTLPDFIKYLDIREELYSKGILMPLVSERDFLACYKTSPEIINDALNNRIDHFMIAEGWWNNYMNNYRTQIIQRNIDNKPSYYIDEIISWFHTSIGFVDPEVSVTPISQGTKQSYIATITALSEHTRLTRRTMGSKYIECLKRAESFGHAHSLMLSPEQNDKTGFIIISNVRSREERLNSLQLLASMAYCAYGLNKICGIATGGLSETERSYDCILIQNYTFEEDIKQKLIEDAKKAFGEAVPYHFTEYNAGIRSKLTFNKTSKRNRNKLCTCGSGKKYKKCCLYIH